MCHSPRLSSPPPFHRFLPAIAATGRDNSSPPWNSTDFYSPLPLQPFFFHLPPCDLYPLRENPLLFETHRTRITSRKMHFKITFVSKRDERLRHAAHVIDSHENGTSFIRVRPNLSRQREKEERERRYSFSRDIKSLQVYTIKNYIDKDLSESSAHVESIINARSMGQSDILEIRAAIDWSIRSKRNNTRTERN